MSDENGAICDNDTTATRPIKGMAKEKPRILVLDDEKEICALFARIIDSDKYAVDVSHSSWEALERIIDHDYGVIFLDVNLPGLSGLEILRYCKQHLPHVEVIMMSGAVDAKTIVKCVKDGAFDFLQKPLDASVIRRTVDKALDNRDGRDRPDLSHTGVISITHEHDRSTTNYKVVKTIGAGMMGIILLVEAGKKRYAMKILRKDVDDGEFKIRLQRFMREAKVLAQINHPNVVKVIKYGYPENHDSPFILMEYVKGKPLTDLIKADALTMEQKVYILAQVASALHAAHSKGILHRDIKPSNILVTRGFDTKLMDFGIAKIMGSALTMSHEAIGSPAYMPPEIFNSKTDVDHRADIFSLGVVAYELMTGQKPFFGETVADIIAAVQHELPEHPCKLNPEIPEDMVGIMAKMMFKNPNERFEDAQQLLRALNKVGKTDEWKSGNTRRILRSLLGLERAWK